MNVDLHERAWKEGFTAGATGQQASTCPYKTPSADGHSWHTGFVEGFALWTRKMQALPQLLDTVEQNTLTIYVRTEVDGVWSNYSLAELPAPHAIHWFAEFIRHRILLTEDKELDLEL